MCAFGFFVMAASESAAAMLFPFVCFASNCPKSNVTRQTLCQKKHITSLEDLATEVFAFGALSSVAPGHGRMNYNDTEP